MTNPKDIKFLVLDVDGTLTDGGIYLLDNGAEAKKFNAKDGLGIKQLQRLKKVRVGMISGSVNNKIIGERAKMLRVEHWYAGNRDKLQVLNDWLGKMKLNSEQVAYIGDDLNDMSIMLSVGLKVCPADAVKSIKEKCDIVLKTNGGEGCVREFIDEYLLD